MPFGMVIMPGGLFPDLSESHRSSIRITLTLLDEALVKFQGWAQGREVRSLLYAEENTLTAAERHELLADIAAIRGIIRELRDDLHLVATPQDIARNILGHCHILWVNILEITGRYLRGYGEPPPELVAYLDPRAQQILQYLDHIKVLLANR
jgi:hypothetical protein